MRELGDFARSGLRRAMPALEEELNHVIFGLAKMELDPEMQIAQVIRGMNQMSPDVRTVMGATAINRLINVIRRGPA